MSEEPQFYEDGSSIFPTEDDGWVAFSSDGTPIGAVDAAGAPIDHEAFVHPDLEADDDLEYGVEDFDELGEQIADLQAWREGFDPAAQIEQARAMGREASGHFAEQAFADHAGRELRNLEVELQRPLTQTETWRILEEHHGDYQAGGTADFSEAVERAGLTPFRPGQTIEGQTDHQRAEARAEYARQLVADAERQTEGREPDDAPAWVEPADDSDIARITANAQNALNYPNQED